jgi:hypothetical protein
MDIKTQVGIMKKLKFKALEIFLMNDQPFTCPYCGARCLEIGNFYNTNAKLLINQCLDTACSFICGEEEDENLLNNL